MTHLSPTKSAITSTADAAIRFGSMVQEVEHANTEGAPVWLVTDHNLETSPHLVDLVCVYDPVQENIGYVRRGMLESLFARWWGTLQLESR